MECEVKLAVGVKRKNKRKAGRHTGTGLAAGLAWMSPCHPMEAEGVEPSLVDGDVAEAERQSLYQDA